jgi:bacterioferritin-associated ferredoxin
MFVCVCQEVTDTQIRNAVHTGMATSVWQLQKCLGVTTACGSCACHVKLVLDAALAEKAEKCCQAMSNPLFNPA